MDQVKIEFNFNQYLYIRITLPFTKKERVVFIFLSDNVMILDFPINSVSVEVISEQIKKIAPSVFSREHIAVSENDFFLEVKNVASYRVQNGNTVYVNPCEYTDTASIKLFLNGSILGAILHQRGILPFHGNSFEFNGNGIIICGNAGVGKSSIAASFCQNGAHFINDDITPIRITESSISILPIKTRFKLWDDSIQQLNIQNQEKEKIRPSIDKYYIQSFNQQYKEQILNYIFILGIHNKDNFTTTEITGMEKFNIMRKQIYRKLYLNGMPETEKCYYHQLLQIASKTKIIRILRPKICDINDSMNIIRKEIL